MAASPKLASVAEFLGVAPDQLEADIKVRPARGPEEAERSHALDTQSLWARVVVIVMAFALTFALSALFIASGKPELAEKVVATLIGLVGGIGIGLSNASKS